MQTSQKRNRILEGIDSFRNDGLKKTSLNCVWEALCDQMPEYAEL